MGLIKSHISGGVLRQCPGLADLISLSLIFNVHSGKAGENFFSQNQTCHFFLQIIVFINTGLNIGNTCDCFKKRGGGIKGFLDFLQSNSNLIGGGDLPQQVSIMTRRKMESEEEELSDTDPD